MEPERRRHYFSAISKSNIISLSTYISISIVLVGVGIGTVLHAFQHRPEIRILLQEEILNATNTWLTDVPQESRDVLASNIAVQCIYYITQNQALIFIAINTYFALVAASCKILIYTFCKELSRQEETVVRNGFCSFFLFSIVFLSVVMQISDAPLFNPWLLWLGYTGFMATMHQVTHQRFKFVAPASGVTGGRLSWLCFGLFVTSYIVFHNVIKYYSIFNWHHFLFLFFDALLCLFRSIHGIVRCLSASDRFSHSPDSVRHFNYWLDLVMLIAVDTAQLLAYLQLVLHSPLGLNLTCFFFLYHTKLTLTSIVLTWNRHVKHKQIFNHIVYTYPVEKAPEGDLCIVCWEELGSSRCLPCAHQFHEWCLMWWLAQDASCPTCRRAVSAPQQPIAPAPNVTTFRFGGGNGFFRLPTVAIEVPSGQFGTFFQRPQITQQSQLTAMAQQVREMFPQLSLEVIMDDLRRTGSTQSTTENVLEGRLGFVGGMIEDETDEDEDHLLDDDLSLTDEEQEAHSFQSSQFDNDSEFAKRRKEMLAKYRKRYIESDKGVDLRERGLSC